MVMRPLTSDTRKGVRSSDIWPVYDAAQFGRSAPYEEDSTSVIADMVSVLSGKEHGSTAEALAFLRQLYPRYPLTLRLAAIVAHSKVSPPFDLGMERPVAQ